MAIIYTTGTINQPDAGSVGLSMAEKIRDDVVAHEAWELVEEFTPSGGAVRWYVLKCLAAESGYDNDFFVVMGRQLSNGELRFAIGESYNTAGKVFGQYGLVGTSSPLLLDDQGRHAQTWVLGTAALTGGSLTPGHTWWTPAGTSTKWWITVTEDGFTVAFNGPSNAFVHIGGYTPLTTLEIGTPVMVWGYNGTQHVTRNPCVASGTVIAYAFTINSTDLNLGFPSDLRYNDKMQDNQRPVAERGITMYAYNGAVTASEYGWALGKQKRVRVGSNVPAGFAFGDAYAMSGRLWVPYLPTTPLIWDTGVASS